MDLRLFLDVEPGKEGGGSCKISGWSEPWPLVVNKLKIVFKANLYFGDKMVCLVVRGVVCCWSINYWLLNPASL